MPLMESSVSSVESKEANFIFCRDWWDILFGLGMGGGIGGFSHRDCRIVGCTT